MQIKFTGKTIDKVRLDVQKNHQDIKIYWIIWNNNQKSK